MALPLNLRERIATDAKSWKEENSLASDIISSYLKMAKSLSDVENLLQIIKELIENENFFSDSFLLTLSHEFQKQQAAHDILAVIPEEKDQKHIDSEIERLNALKISLSIERLAEVINEQIAIGVSLDELRVMTQNYRPDLMAHWDQVMEIVKKKNMSQSIKRQVAYYLNSLELNIDKDIDAIADYLYGLASSDPESLAAVIRAIREQNIPNREDLVRRLEIKEKKAAKTT